MIIKKASRIADVKSYYFASKLQEVREMNADGGLPVINLGIGNPDLSPPTSVLDKLNKSSKNEYASQYQPYRGVAPLRSAFSKWYKKWYNIDLNDKSEVLPLIGSKEGIMHISMSFIEQGDGVLIPNPGYPAYKMCTKIAGGKALPYDLKIENNWLPDLDEIAIKNDLSEVKLMWINYPHMPTGAKSTKAFYEELIPWAKENKILICSDNPYSFILNDNMISPLQIDGAKEVCVELTSLSKCYNMAGWRVGALIGDKDYVDSVLTFKSNMDSGMFKPIQEAAIEALSLEQSWINTLNKEYQKRKLIVFDICDLLGLEYEKNSAGLFIWGRLPHDLFSAADVIDRILKEARVFITPGHIFGTAGEGYIRVSLCNTESNLKTALDRIHNLQKSIA